ncbi:hypothetical protein NM680_18845, partial [Paracoccus sp. PS-1]|nr:hypothetical protein [Paracoccus sp. PS1]
MTLFDTLSRRFLQPPAILPRPRQRFEGDAPDAGFSEETAERLAAPPRPPLPRTEPPRPPTPAPAPRPAAPVAEALPQRLAPAPQAQPHPAPAHAPAPVARDAP